LVYGVQTDSQAPGTGKHTPHEEGYAFRESESVATPKDVLTEILRRAAERMLAAAVEAEVAAYLARHESALDESGQSLVVRNGYCPERTIQTGLGSVAVSRPRVDDRRVDDDGCRIEIWSKVVARELKASAAYPWC